MKGSQMKNFVLPMVISLALAACVSDDESVPKVPPLDSTFKASFVPAGGVMPFPNDLFFSGTTDGTVNMPVQDPTDVSDYLVAMNGQDGYSTTASIFVPFNGPLDGGSITAATVRLINVTNPLAPVPQTFGTVFTANVSPATDGTKQLQIKPLVPLTAKARYAFIITRGITSGAVAAVADTTMQQMLDIHTAGAPVPAALAPIYTTAGYGNLFTLANAFGIPDANIAVVGTFSTQSTSDVLTNVNTNAVAGTIAVIGAAGTNKSLLDPGNTNPGIVNMATIYAGFIAVPYYSSRTSLMTGHWHNATGGEVTRYSPAPTATETINIPFLLSVPNAGSPSAGVKPVTGWPIIVFQHGITGNRTNMIAIAQAYANAGYAIVAIDHPLHGLPVGHPLRAFNTAVPLTTIYEPTFDADVSNNTTGAPGADGTVDASGQNFINLSSLLTSRDNLRQSAADLIRLAKSVTNLSYDGIAGGDFDTSRMQFTGHSLGAIVGGTFLGVNTNVQAATLAMPGGTIAQLLRDSPTFGPRINAGLAANGVVAGTQLYEAFLQAAQTAVDSGDPINFATAANANHAIHLIQVVGNGLANLPDQVVPNSATARLIAALGLSKKSTVGAFANTEGYVNFTAGDHSSILSPAASLAALVEMQTETATFMGANGAAFTIANAAVVQP